MQQIDLEFSKSACGSQTHRCAPGKAFRITRAGVAFNHLPNGYFRIMPEIPVEEIVEFVGGSYRGPNNVRIVAVAPLTTASASDLSFLANPKYSAQLSQTAAGAVLVPANVANWDPRWIEVADPYFQLARVLTRWFDRRPVAHGISPLAAIASSAVLGDRVAIGPFTSVSENVVLEDGVRIGSGVSIGAGSRVGSESLLHPNVVVYDGCMIGRRCIIHAGAVIGSDGYGFATHEGNHYKIPQIGSVRVEDDVEIGAGTTIDRAAFGETVIGQGTKVDNLVQIGHNVKVGRNCLLVSQVGIAGSTELGDSVFVAGQSGFSGHLKIGSRVQVAAKSAVLADVADDEKVMGSPALPFNEFARRQIALKRLASRKK